MFCGEDGEGRGDFELDVPGLVGGQGEEGLEEVGGDGGLFLFGGRWVGAWVGGWVDE